MRSRQVLTGFALLVAFALGACKGGGAVVAPPPVTPPALPSDLELVRTVALAVPEPSDLCLDRDRVHLWTVSDNTGLVYRLRLADLVVDRTLSYHGEDPEGIWQSPADGTLFVTEERTRQIVHLDSMGVELGRVTVPGLGGKENNGLEGITFSPVLAHFLLLQQREPARIVEADSSGHVLELRPITFVSELSGVSYDGEEDQLLIVSASGRRIARTSTAGSLVASWAIPVEAAEGIALDRARGRIYVVSDDLAKFYEFVAP